VDPGPPHGLPGTIVCGRSGSARPTLHVYDHDAALRCVSVLFCWIFVLRRIWTAALVAQGNLESRALMAPPLLFLAATDLFDDPRFEH
jgi:hypothetical protein